LKAGRSSAGAEGVALLSPQQKDSKTGVLFHLRMFEATGEHDRTAQLLAASSIEDGNSIFKAKQFFREIIRRNAWRISS